MAQLELADSWTGLMVRRHFPLDELSSVPGAQILRGSVATGAAPRFDRMAREPLSFAPRSVCFIAVS